MNILGIEFDNKTKMIDVIKELNKRGISGSTIPLHYYNAKQGERVKFDYSQKSAQDILNEVMLEENYKDLTKWHPMMMIEA